jgi:hypothetical protein
MICCGFMAEYVDVTLENYWKFLVETLSVNTYVLQISLIHWFKYHFWCICKLCCNFLVHVQESLVNEWNQNSTTGNMEKQEPETLFILLVVCVVHLATVYVWTLDLL